MLLGAGVVGPLCAIAPSALELNLNPEMTGVGGAAAGAMIGWLLFRLTVALSLGAILALAVGLGAATWLHLRVDPPAVEADAVVGPPAPDPEDRPTPEPDVPTLEVAAGETSPWSPASPDVPSAAMQAFGVTGESAGSTVRAVYKLVVALGERAIPIWNGMPRSSRLLITGAAGLGLLIGLCLGLAAPKRAAAATTALTGPVLWLPAALSLGAAFGAPVARFLPDSPAAWGLMWAVTSGLGLAVQWRSARRSTDKD